MKSRDTKPELYLQEALANLEISYELHVASLPGTPDIAIATHKIAIYVHGCYWHRHQYCGLKKNPVVRSPQWAQTFNQIVLRDVETQKAIAQLGWDYFVAWECVILESPLDQALLIFKLMKKRESQGTQ